jgi:hypothetical protein
MRDRPDEEGGGAGGEAYAPWKMLPNYRRVFVAEVDAACVMADYAEFIIGRAFARPVSQSALRTAAIED